MRVKANAEGGEINFNIDIRSAVKNAAETVAEAARELCPTDTGTLKNSIAVSVDGDSAYVSAGADYAAYVEFGTSKAPAQPFLVPALLNGRDAAAARIAEAIGEMK